MAGILFNMLKGVRLKWLGKLMPFNINEEQLITDYAGAQQAACGL